MIAGWEKPEPGFTLDGLYYRYERTRETDFTMDYVPDWDAVRAMRESIQNQLDEALVTNTRATVEATNDRVLLRDQGRGVTMADILHIGKSGKRSNDNTVGNHGEGEVMSFLVCVRLGIPKTMASQTWAVRARQQQDAENGDLMLVYDVYRTETPRAGTLWEYQSYDAAHVAAQAYDQFVRHEAMWVGSRRAEVWYAICDALRPYAGHHYFTEPPHDRSRLITDEAGTLYSRGLQIGDAPWSVACSYNLRAHPGRDRQAFRWEDVKAECATIWALEANAAAVAHVLDWMIRQHYEAWEAGLEQGPSKKVVAAAVEQVRQDKGYRALVWASQGHADAAAVADALALPDVKVLSFYGTPPAWLQAGLPHIHTITKLVRAELAAVKMPKPLQAVIEGVAGLCLMPFTTIEARTLPDGKDGGGDHERIMFDPAKCATWDFPYLVETVVHELAHVSSKQEDCTRAHADAISKLSVLVMRQIARDPSVWQKLEAQFTAWTETQQN